VLLGNFAAPEAVARLGDFVALGNAAIHDIRRAQPPVVVPGCGHILHIEHPGQFLDALLRFLPG
jgi:pimeloyl-ACP methyl ester carboxylesterase